MNLSARMSNDASLANASAAGTAGVDGPSLDRWERQLVVVLIVGLVFAVVAWFLARPNLASTMLEYALKFDPLFIDGSASSILDFYGVGDPRGRVINSFFTWINIHARKELLLTMAIHPALSVNWLLYPITLAVLYAALRRMSNGVRYPVIATLLYAASPAMLDVLIDYYLPAKALMNFWFAAALYGVSMFLPREHKPRPVVGAFLLGTSTFLGLLSDETAIFIPICVCLLFGREMFFGADGGRNRMLIGASFVISFAVFALVVLVAVPVANAALGQVPLDWMAVVLDGAHSAMFDVQSATNGNLARYAPFSLLQTIMSAHFVPSRTVLAAWVSGDPLPWFFQWSAREQLALYSVLIVAIVLGRNLPAAPKAQASRAAWTILGYVFLQAFVLLPLMGYLTESSYYAALASILLALLVGSITAAPGRSPGMRKLSWTLVVYVLVVQFANVVDTALRHPYLGIGPLTWSELNGIYTRIARGEIEEVLSTEPFPYRRFLYAFETAAAFESAKGRRVDFRPMQEPQPGIVRHLDIDRWADPRIAPMSSPSPQSVVEATSAALPSIPVGAKFFHAGTVRGEIGKWGYRWQFDGSGSVTQTSWRFGLIRLWSTTGHVEQQGNEVCLVFSEAPKLCFATLYRQDEWMLAFDADGQLVTRFKWESEQSR